MNKISPAASSAPDSHPALLEAMARSAKAVEAVLEQVLPKPHGLHAQVHEAMRYATLGGGKRLRPFLVLHSARLFGVDDACALRAAAAIEVLHTYSLVHDDLPCMDDDDMRRGRPTTHRVHGVAIATAAGVAMVPLAVRAACDAAAQLGLPYASQAAIVRELMRASGGGGMVGGQLLDLEGEGSSLSIDQLERI